MSEPHLYTGHRGMYPHDRDARDLPLGLLSPGDVRELDEPLDQHWVPLEGNEELRALLLAQLEAERKAAEDAESGTEDGESADGASDGAQLPRRQRRTPPGIGGGEKTAPGSSTTAGEPGTTPEG
jgi:hypothetical protein